MHGREGWYQHDYTGGELTGVRNKIAGICPERAYIFFNNNHAMLADARTMMRLFEGAPSG